MENDAFPPPPKEPRVEKNHYFELYEATNYKPEVTDDERNNALKALQNGHHDLRILYLLTRILQRNDMELPVDELFEKYPWLKDVSLLLVNF